MFNFTQPATCKFFSYYSRQTSDICIWVEGKGNTFQARVCDLISPFELEVKLGPCFDSANAMIEWVETYTKAGGWIEEENNNVGT